MSQPISHDSEDNRLVAISHSRKSHNIAQPRGEMAKNNHELAGQDTSLLKDAPAQFNSMSRVRSIELAGEPQLIKSSFIH